ncbi:hypothetical protein [Microcystis sp.]|uniref:hypothetical protein n=1 Tax=Microcystis sp. TaxID=1127 RepID=UPI003AF85E4B
MSTPYDNCFDHITDPVQRNSVRQQWLQMVCGGLFVADVRILLLATLKRNPTALNLTF